MSDAILSAGPIRPEAVSDAPKRRVSQRYPILSTTFDLWFDYTAFLLAWPLTVQVRLLLNSSMTAQLTREKLNAAEPSLVGILLFWAVSKIWFNPNARNQHHSAALPSMQFARSIFTVFTVAIVSAFFSQNLGAPISRLFVLLYAAISYSLLLLTSILNHHAWQSLIRDWPRLVEKIAVIGHPADAEAVSADLRRNAAAAFTGVIVPSDLDDHERPSGGSVPVLGATCQVAEVVNREKLNRVIILNAAVSEEECQRCTRVLHRMGVVTDRVLNVAWATGTVVLNNDFGMQLLELRPVSFTRVDELIKRSFDIVSSLICLTLSLPVMLIAGCIVRLTSPGPILYRSQRVGKGGRHFTFLKLRTMYHDPHGRNAVGKVKQADGHLFKIRFDPRITPSGRFLRRYSIDELPQLLNVLRGDMSLIGPRPLPAGDLDPDGMSSVYKAWAEQRASVPPGVTGLWQIRGRSDLSFKEMVDLDLEYVSDRSFLLDLKILLATPLAILTGKGAY
jgi:exopolysaccharide biosynthesis polyprenyl glycosylphosphotransferase